MIYLIKDREYLKIGYTKNIDSRMATYKTHNPHVELLASKEGIRKDEKALHELCAEYKYDTEWFYYNDNIIKIFNSYTSVISVLWQDAINEIQKIINNIVTTINTDLNSIKSHYSYRFTQISRKTDDFFYTIKHCQLSEKEQFYKNFVSLYHASFPIYEKEQSYIHAIMHHRMPLFIFMYKHDIITKEQLLKISNFFKQACKDYIQNTVQEILQQRTKAQMQILELEKFLKDTEDLLQRAQDIEKEGMQTIESEFSSIENKLQ